jgi:hypothetical protein
MERLSNLAISSMHRSGRFESAATVVGLHVAAVFGLLAALKPGAVMNEIRIIQASIDTPQGCQNTAPRAP